MGAMDVGKFGRNFGKEFLAIVKAWNGFPWWVHVGVATIAFSGALAAIVGLVIR